MRNGMETWHWNVNTEWHCDWTWSTHRRTITCPTATKMSVNRLSTVNMGRLAPDKWLVSKPNQRMDSLLESLGTPKTKQQV